MKRLLPLLLVLLISQLVLAAQPLKVGIFPRYTQAETERLFQPMIQQLAGTLGQQLELITSPDFPAFWTKIQSQQFDLVHYNQYHYVKAASRYGHRVLVSNQEFGRNQLRAGIVVPKDSPIRSLAQLRDHKVLFGGGRSAMVSYIMATDLLRSAGLGPGDYVQQTALTPDSAVTSLYYRQGDAASASDVILQRKDLPWPNGGADLRTLAVSQPVAHLPWAVSTRVSEDLAKRLKQTLLALNQTPAGKRALTKAHLSGLVSVSDADYDLPRQIIARVLQEHY